MNPLTRHRKLLENKKVERWYLNLKARSQVTSDVYIRNLGLWLEYLEKDPDSIIIFARDSFEDFKGSVSDKIRALESKGTMGSSISTSLKALLSYLKFNNVSLKLVINIKNENRSLNAEKEVIPGKEELAKMLRMASLRERVSISLMAFSGLRPEVLGNIDGSDGLKIGDIPDLRINERKVTYDHVPIRVNIRPDLSKIRTAYFTFLGPEGSEYLKEYLESRITSGESLTEDSPIIMPVEKQSLEKKNRFLLTTLLLRRIKGTIVKAGYDWRPYIFRIYFGTNLDSAEAKKQISHPWRQFIMGHKGDIEETYTKREGKTDEGRGQYSQCLSFIETKEEKITQDEVKKGFRVEFLSSVLGYSQEKIAQLDLANMSNEEFQDLVKKGILGNITGNGTRQKIVTEKELEKYMNEGYEVFTTLPSGKIVMKLP